LAITGITWYFLISAIVVSVGTIIFVILMIRQCFIKRTQGAIILSLFYLFLAIAEILNTAGLWYSVFISEINKVSAYMELSFPLFYGIGYLFLYNFLVRHIVQDNDLIKSSISIILVLFIGIICSFMFAEVFYDISDPIAYQLIYMDGPDIIQFLPTLFAGIFIFLPIFLLVHIRIIVIIFRIRRVVNTPLEKIGFSFILFSLIFLISSSLVASLFTITGIEEIPGIYALLHSLRTFLLGIGLLFGYFGWIFPTWLKGAIDKHYIMSLDSE